MSAPGAKFRQIAALPDPGASANDRETNLAAALAICARAKNAGDARLLLDACGLIPDNGEA